MNIHARIRSITTTTTTCDPAASLSSPFLSSTSSSSLLKKSPPSTSSFFTPPQCSKRNLPPEPPRNGDGDKSSRDWDKAWSSFKKQGKKTLFSQFSPNKYVTWNPKPSDYPLSEEVDPIKRTERSNLRLWTSPGFTLVGAIVLVSFLLIYTILAPVK